MSHLTPAAQRTLDRLKGRCRRIERAAIDARQGRSVFVGYDSLPDGRLIVQLNRADCSRVAVELLPDGRAIWPRRERLVLAATEIVGGEYVVCRGDALGAVVARFPRSLQGETAARKFITMREVRQCC